MKDAFGSFDRTFKIRIADADEFYERVAPHSLNEDQRRVHRQAVAGMLWSKQFYHYDVDVWLDQFRRALQGSDTKVTLLPYGGVSVLDDLELSLGTKLFVRTSAGATLTHSGALMLPSAQAVLALMRGIKATTGDLALAA